jgi:hypothetical protein
MATKARKPASTTAKATGKATQSKAGAGPATAQRSKDAAKPAFGKAAPKRVTSAAAKAAKPAAKAAKPAKTGGKDGSITTKMARGVKTTASAAAGAVVATAKGAVSLAASVVGKGGSRKARTK